MNAEWFVAIVGALSLAGGAIAGVDKFRRGRIDRFDELKVSARQLVDDLERLLVDLRDAERANSHLNEVAGTRLVHWDDAYQSIFARRLPREDWDHLRRFMDIVVSHLAPAMGVSQATAGFELKNHVDWAGISALQAAAIADAHAETPSLLRRLTHRERRLIRDLQRRERFAEFDRMYDDETRRAFLAVLERRDEPSTRPIAEDANEGTTQSPKPAVEPD